MPNQIGQICKGARYQIRNIGKIRPCLNTPIAEKLICFVSIKLDNLNSLLFGLPKWQVTNLHLEYRMLHLVTRTKKYDHITPVLYDLHWLPESH